MVVVFDPSIVVLEEYELKEEWVVPPPEIVFFL